ncbi:MAG: peptidoglycan DD-metalloendopeptidase family protein [Oscillospiraceae bacterium]|nr:peptidoglycan DD-metalloendopeptidase family protein [Oscillospiraceae bacterium]
MKQTERDHKTQENKKEEIETAGQNSTRPTGGWRDYIEQAEAAEKKAEQEAAKARAAQIKASKKRFQPKALADKAKAAFSAAKKGGAGQGQLKEKAARAGKNLVEAAEMCWEKTCAVTAEGWDKAGRATAKVRGVVARHPVSPLLYATILAVGVGVVAFKSTYIRAYAMEVNGEPVAVVSSPDEKDAIVSNIESRASDILGEQYDYDAEISMTPVYVTPDELSDTAQVEDALFEDVGAWMTAYGLRVDGQELGYAATQEELYRMLDAAAQPYLTADTVSYEFVENVEVYPIEMPSNTKFDVEPIRETLAQMRVEQSTYVVKKGDTFNAIAYSLDMWPYELSVLNPDVIVDKLWVDQELVIQEAVPYLSVQNFTDETYEEAIPSPVEYIETADLYVGDTKVKEQGEDGLARVNARVTYVNGVEVEREILQSTTLEEPTTTYTYTGTTPRPVTASNGYFIWPVRGTITSNFGGRSLWGRYDFHLGLDIACPTGTSVKAADGGTVIKSGWSGSYGKLVAIRHDNGYITYYAHNSSLLVSVGDKVYQGQVIARVGMTGNASGPHCHFEVRINGTSVNPRNYLR